MPQPGSGGSILSNLITQRNRLSAARQKIGLEAGNRPAPATRGAPQSNLRPIGPPPRPKTAEPATPRQRPAAPAPAPAQAPARTASPQPAAAGRDQMLGQVTEFLGQIQQVAPQRPQPAPQSRGEAALGRARRILQGGL